MRIMKLQKVLMPVFVAAMITLGLAGCADHGKKSNSEHPGTEHPGKEHPTDEKSSTEHPSSEHPK